MNPKKAKSYINIISKDLNEDVELLECLIDFYYKECRNALSNLKYDRLNIDGLGHFKSRNNLVKKSIDKINKDLNNHDTSTFKAYYNKKNLEEKLKLLTNLAELNNIEMKRKDEFKKEKNESKKHLEK
jgi:hypothetical protein|tara:strand:+ start:1582 stop:1965 length:384 start_codon:yes stop_codon:yes gene_type:complete